MPDIKPLSDGVRSDNVEKSNSSDILRRMCAQASRDTSSASSSPRGTDSVPSSSQERGKRSLSAWEMAEEEQQRKSSPIGEDGKPAEKALDLHSTAMLGGMPRGRWDKFLGKHDGEASTSSGSSNLERANLEYNCAEIRNSLKNWKFSKATELCERLLATTVRECGPDHPKTRATVDALHEIVKDSWKYSDMWKYWEGWKNLARSVFDTCKQKLGPDHPKTLETLNILHNIPKTLFNEHMMNYTVDLKKFIISLCEQNFGSDHDKTLYAMKNLQKFLLKDYRKTGIIYNKILYEKHYRYDLMDMNDRIISICEQKWGPNDSKTLDAVDIAVKTYLEQKDFYYYNDYQRAVKLGERLVPICERMLGEDHIQTAKVRNGLAKDYFEQREYQKSKALYERVLPTFQRKFGKNHSKTQTCQQKLNQLSDWLQQNNVPTASSPEASLPRPSNDPLEHASNQRDLVDDAPAQNRQEIFRVPPYQKAAGKLLGIAIPPMHLNFYQQACKAARFAAIQTGKFLENDQFEQMHKAIFFKRAYAGDRNSAEFKRLVEQHKKVFPYEIKRAHWQWKLTKCLGINYTNEREYNLVNQIEDKNGLVLLIDERTRGQLLPQDKTQEIDKLKEEFDQIKEEERKIYGR